MAFDSILVSTGYPLSSAIKTEIINTDNDGLTCKDLEEYPLQIARAVGFNMASFNGFNGENMASLPVICGGKWTGHTNPTQCYRTLALKIERLVEINVLNEIGPDPVRMMYCPPSDEKYHRELSLVKNSLVLGSRVLKVNFTFCPLTKEKESSEIKKCGVSQLPHQRSKVIFLETQVKTRVPQIERIHSSGNKFLHGASKEAL